MNEGRMYPQDIDARRYTGRIHSYEDVHKDGHVINTRVFIRKEVVHRRPLEKPNTNDNGKRENEHIDRLEQLESLLVANWVDGRILIETPRGTEKLIWRVLARTLLEDYGWSIKDFRDLLELLTVLDHTITGMCFVHSQFIFPTS
jgi:hypothetical protein